MAASWQGWKRVVRKPLDLKLCNGIRFRAYPDCTCSSSAVYFRMPNGRHLEFLRNYARGGTFLDVGANVGLISMLLADSVQHAVLFEPNSMAASRARENIRLNRLPFEVHEVALSDSDGTTAFENLGSVNTCNRTITSKDASHAGVRTITVPKDSFDHFYSERPAFARSVTAVKIDVEGHENWVLRGMKHLLLTDRPIVMFEYLQRTKLEETFALFASAGYRVMALSSQGLVPADLHVAPLQDLFALPSERCGREVRVGRTALRT